MSEDILKDSCSRTVSKKIKERIKKAGKRFQMINSESQRMVKWIYYRQRCRKNCKVSTNL